MFYLQYRTYTYSLFKYLIDSYLKIDCLLSVSNELQFEKKFHFIHFI